MTAALHIIALRRLRLLTLEPRPVSVRPEGQSSSPDCAELVCLSELARLGIAIANPELLSEAGSRLLMDYEAMLSAVARLRGGGVNYVPLFTNFPDDIPEDKAYFAKRVLGYLGNVLGSFEAGPKLADGRIVPEWLFDLGDFGADPITQFQDPVLYANAVREAETRTADTHVEWLAMEFVHADELEARLLAWLQSCLYAKSSIKESMHRDLATVLAHVDGKGIDVSRITMRENLALFLTLLWRQEHYGLVALAVASPTDVLRMFAALTGGDVSLGKPIAFPKLRRPERRAVLGILESCRELEEGLQRHRGLWLAIGRSFHVGEYKRAFPKTCAAFAALRAGEIRTFASTTEALMASESADAVLAHLQARPGVLGRKVHELLRRFPKDASEILRVFEGLSSRMTVKNLLVLQSYFASINSLEMRTVVNKKGGIKVLPNNAKDALTGATLTALATILDAALLRSIGERDSWRGKSVYIDPALAGYTVPLAQRAASDGVLTFGRGTHLPLDADKVLRLFVYWKDTGRTTDLDLSVIQYKSDFAYAGHVSFTNLSSGGIVHSGDVQSAPLGAAEFIDITRSAIASDVRYLAVQVYRYAGDHFADLDCRAGWMVRSHVDSSYESFDIKTVQNAFDLHGRSSYCMPLIVDLQANEVIMTDLYIGSNKAENSVEGARDEVAITTEQVVHFTQTRPTMKTLAEYHARARGASIVTERDADIGFGTENCTYNASDVETIVSELL